jgi:hypothetical protein
MIYYPFQHDNMSCHIVQRHIDLVMLTFKLEMLCACTLRCIFEKDRKKDREGYCIANHHMAFTLKNGSTNTNQHNRATPYCVNQAIFKRPNAIPYAHPCNAKLQTRFSLLTFHISHDQAPIPSPFQLFLLSFYTPERERESSQLFITFPINCPALARRLFSCCETNVFSILTRSKPGVATPFASMSFTRR